MVWKSEDLLSAPEDTIVINAKEISFIMSKKIIQQCFDIFS
jgi:hypothetical protein